MLSVLLNTQYLRRKTILNPMQNYKRCTFLKPIFPHLQALSSSCDPCSCGGGSGAGGSKHKITFTPYKPPKALEHDYKNMALGRPMSPHLTIFAPTLPATTSIFQRITGIILVFYAVLLAGGTLFLSNGVETYVSMIQSLNLNRLSILLIKILLGAPFAFHYFNGIRFCMWNTGRWLAMKDVYTTANKCFTLTVVATLLFAIL